VSRYGGAVRRSGSRGNLKERASTRERSKEFALGREEKEWVVFCASNAALHESYWEVYIHARV